MDSRIKHRISFLNVPIDTYTKESSIEKIKEILNAQDGQNHQIVFLDVKKLLKARGNREYFRCLRTASLILPTSRAIIKGAHFQRKQVLTRFNQFEFVIRLLSAADELKKSVYILGGKKGDLEKVESNLRTSFPNMQIVGRYIGNFNKETEKNILLAIKKSSPSFIIVGSGIKKTDLWIMNNRDHLNPGIFIDVGNCFEIFSGKKNKVSQKLFNIGLESMQGFFTRPWKIFKIFPYIYFKLLVLIFKIRRL
jgi:N-acetylglucosaminyldiphosphoundecaprenol N-acetyl-beta-D-mannosaminyltransferase